MELLNNADGVKAEFVLNHLPENSFRLSFNGLHGRNACNDFAEAEVDQNGKLVFGLCRKSLYDSLPEYMFHPYDRFDGHWGKENKEDFDRELDKQEEEKAKALELFAPMDLSIMHIRMRVAQQLEDYTQNNLPVIEMLADRLTMGQRNNRFIKKAVSFLPQVGRIRGNRTALTLMLRKVFANERIKLEASRNPVLLTETEPCFNDSLGGSLDSVFVGNSWYEPVFCYDIHYWNEEECDEHFLSYVEDVELCRHFVKDYFLAVGDDLVFNIWNNSSPLRLSDEEKCNYLNYNTNI